MLSAWTDDDTPAQYPRLGAETRLSRTHRSTSWEQETQHATQAALEGKLAPRPALPLCTRAGRAAGTRGSFLEFALVSPSGEPSLPLAVSLILC